VANVFRKISIRPHKMPIANWLSFVSVPESGSEAPQQIKPTADGSGSDGEYPVSFWRFPRGRESMQSWSFYPISEHVAAAQVGGALGVVVARMMRKRR
jgi:hypothetical protein